MKADGEKVREGISIFRVYMGNLTVIVYVDMVVGQNVLSMG